MEIELTKSAKKSLATIYKDYCQRIQEGKTKRQAIYFDQMTENVSDNMAELKKAGFVKMDIVGGFELTDHAIIFMENRTIDTIKEWLSFGTQFIP